MVNGETNMVTQNMVTQNINHLRQNQQRALVVCFGATNKGLLWHYRQSQWISLSAIMRTAFFFSFSLFFSSPPPSPPFFFSSWGTGGRRGWGAVKVGFSKPRPLGNGSLSSNTSQFANLISFLLRLKDFTKNK